MNSSSFHRFVAKIVIEIPSKPIHRTIQPNFMSTHGAAAHYPLGKAITVRTYHHKVFGTLGIWVLRLIQLLPLRLRLLIKGNGW
jgi:hypothetical protein